MRVIRNKQRNYKFSKKTYQKARNAHFGTGIGEKKKSPAAAIVIVSLLFVLAAGVAAFFIMGGTSLLAGDADSDTAYASLDKSLLEHMSYEGEKYENACMSAESYTVNYPVTQLDDIDTKIKSRAEYLAKCAEASSASFTAVDYITETADDKYLSLVFKAKEYDSDGEQGSSYASTMMFSLETNEILDDGEIFKSSFYNFASEYVRSFFEGGDDLNDDNSENFLAATTADKLHFGEYSISDSECTLYMNQKELFGSGGKLYEISIPLSELSGYLELSLKGTENTTQVSSTIRKDLDADKPMIALTFDDGPSAEYTEEILEVLKEYNSRATFFVVGYNAEENTDVLKKISEYGCQIGNHTKDHSDLTEMTEEEIKEEADYVDEIVEKATGSPTTALRPPYGSYNDTVREILNETPLILWSIDTEDWSSLDKDEVVKNVKEQAYDGSIILMHDIYSSTAEAAKEIIPYLVSEGYQLVTVEELLYYRSSDTVGGDVYP